MGGTKRQGQQGMGYLRPQNCRKMCRETGCKKREKRKVSCPQICPELEVFFRKRDNILVQMRKWKQNRILHLDHRREQAQGRGLQVHRGLLFLLFLHSAQKAETPALHWEHASSGAATERTSCPKPLAALVTQTCRYGEVRTSGSRPSRLLALMPQLCLRMPKMCWDKGVKK